MEGLRCPICKAISLVKEISDGEIFTCPFCNCRYTVTSVRRYYLQPQTKNLEDINLTNLDTCLKDLKSHQLVEIVQLISKELSRRLPREKECIVVQKGSNVLNI